MKTKEDRLKMFCRTEMHKREESGEKEHIPYHLIFGMSLAVVLLFAGVGMATATTIFVATDGSGDYNCDGTDDHIEINQAIAYIDSIGGGTVHLKNGTYIINGSIEVCDSLVLEGDSWETIIKVKDNVTEETFPRGTGLILSESKTNITLQNFKLDGNKDNQTLPHAENYLDLIYFKSHTTNSTIREIWLYTGLCDGVVLNACDNIRVTNNRIEDVIHDSIRLRPADNCLIADNYIPTGGNSAVRFDNGCNNTVINNIMPGTPHGWYGVEIGQYGWGDTSNNKILNNVISGKHGSGIVFTALNTQHDSFIENNEIRGNIIFDTSIYGYGIQITERWINMTIVNNVLSNNKYGIYSSDSSDNIFTRNNIIVNNTLYGICGSNIISTCNNVWNNTQDDYNGLNAGTGDISVDPLFADSANDFHLKSEYGRWSGYGWDYDNVTSPCLGAGELNGEKINMGAYGNTAEASKASNETATHPTITLHTPTGVMVPVGTTITVTFSKAMNTSSAEGAFSISPDVSGAFSWIENEMIFTPDYNLDYEKTYTVILNTTAEDLEENNLASTFSWQFTTRAPGMDLVAEWLFEEGSGDFAEDTSVNTNNGTLVNMDVTAWVAGTNGTALQFDGVDDYVDCGNDASLDITDAITIETWLNPNVAGEGVTNAAPVCKAEAEVDWSWQLRYNAPGGYMGFQFNGDPEGSTWVSVNQNLTPGDWYHIAGTFDGTTLRCYLNGVETDTNLLSAIKSGNATLFIGQDGWGNIFNGTIDEVKIYNRALSADEIEEDYEAGLVEQNSLSGTVTSPCGTNIPNATVTLATLEGDLINTTQTDSTGNYTFTDISAGTYNLTVTKPRFWPTNNITVTTGNTENIMLWLKGDLNLNGTQADSSDLLMMDYAATGGLIPDWKFDLNGNGDLADAGDVLMLEEAAAGKIELL